MREDQSWTALDQSWTGPDRYSVLDQSGLRTGLQSLSVPSGLQSRSQSSFFEAVLSGPRSPVLGNFPRGPGPDRTLQHYPPSSLGPRVQLPAYNFPLRRSRDEDYRTRFSTQHAQDGCEYGFINVLSSEPDGVDQVNTVCVAFFSLRDVLSEPALLRSPMSSARRRSRLRV